VEVEYEITPADLYAFQWRGVFDSPRGRRARLNVYLGWVLAIVLYSIVPAIGADGFTISLVNVGFIAIAMPIVFLFQWCLERWLVRRAIRQLLREERPGKGQLGRHRVVLDEKGLSESTAVGESRTTWAGVDRVEQNRDYIFIYIAPAVAHVVPKRAFADPRQAEAFYELSRTRKAAAG
jgi:YcxB-like protein